MGYLGFGWGVEVMALGEYIAEINAIYGEEIWGRERRPRAFDNNETEWFIFSLIESFTFKFCVWKWNTFNFFFFFKFIILIGLSLMNSY